MVFYYGAGILPDAWKSEQGLQLLHLVLDEILDEDELRQRTIKNNLTPSRAYKLTFSATSDPKLAQEAKEKIERELAKENHGN